MTTASTGKDTMTLNIVLFLLLSHQFETVMGSIAMDNNIVMNGRRLQFGKHSGLGSAGISEQSLHEIHFRTDLCLLPCKEKDQVRLRDDIEARSLFDRSEEHTSELQSHHE